MEFFVVMKAGDVMSPALKSFPTREQAEAAAADCIRSNTRFYDLSHNNNSIVTEAIVCVPVSRAVVHVEMKPEA